MKLAEKNKNIVTEEIATNERFLDPTNDVAFKRIFSNKDKLMDFLNATFASSHFNKKIVDLTFISNEQVPDRGQDKRILFDLRAKDETGKTYIIEMQNRFEPDFLNRTQYYGSHALTSQIQSGVRHDNLEPVVVVAITKAQFLDDDAPCISYHPVKETTTGKVYFGLLSYIFIELSKFTKKDNELKTAADEWLCFLSLNQKTKAVPAFIKDKYVIEAYNDVERFNWTAAQYDAYIRAWLLARAEVATKEYERREGRAEGKAERDLEIVSRMLLKKISIEDIMDITGLSREEVEKLKLCV